MTEQAHNPRQQIGAAARLARLLAATELWWSLGLAAALLFVERALWPLLALIPLLWGVSHFVAHRRWLLRAPTNRPLLLFLLWLPVPVWASADWLLTRVALAQVVTGVVVFVGVCHWVTTWHRLKVMVWLLAALTLGLAVAAPFAVTRGGTHFFALPGPLEALAQRFPESVNPNVLAGALALLLPPLLALLLVVRRWSSNRRGQRALSVALAAALALGLAALVFSQSRGASVALVAALGCVLALQGRRGWLVLLALALGAVALVANQGPERIVESLSAGQAISSWQGRVEVWSRARYAVADFPITGIGLGTFSRIIPLFYPYFVLAGADIPHAHNLLLQVAVDVGLPGLAAYLALWGMAVALAARSYGRAPHPIGRMLAVGLLGSNVVLFVHGLADAVAWSSKVAVVPWLLMGLTLALHRLSSRME